MAAASFGRPGPRALGTGHRPGRSAQSSAPSSLMPHPVRAAPSSTERMRAPEPGGGDGLVGGRRELGPCGGTRPARPPPAARRPRPLRACHLDHGPGVSGGTSAAPSSSGSILRRGRIGPDGCPRPAPAARRPVPRPLASSATLRAAAMVAARFSCASAFTFRGVGQLGGGHRGGDALLWPLFVVARSATAAASRRCSSAISARIDSSIVAARSAAACERGPVPGVVDVPAQGQPSAASSRADPARPGPPAHALPARRIGPLGQVDGPVLPRSASARILPRRSMRGRALLLLGPLLWGVGDASALAASGSLQDVVAAR